MSGIWKKSPIIEKIEFQGKSKLDIEFLKRDTTAKTFRGFLRGCLQKVRNDENIEMSTFFVELIKKFDEFYPQKVIRIEILQGYKNYGEAHPLIWKGVKEDYYIRIWHNEGYENKIVKKEHINRLIWILKDLDVGQSLNCYQIALKLKYGHNEKEAWQNLWARRMTDYFPKYYHPLLVIKALGYIKYGKKGVITRLK